MAQKMCNLLEMKARDLGVVGSPRTGDETEELDSEIKMAR